MTDYADLVKRLRTAMERGWIDKEPIDAIEALVKERDDYLQFWKNNFEACEAAEAEVAKLKEALTKITDYGDGTGCNPRWFIEIARAALEGK